MKRRSASGKASVLRSLFACRESRARMAATPSPVSPPDPMAPFTARVVCVHRRRRSGGVGRVRQPAGTFRNRRRRRALQPFRHPRLSARAGSVGLDRRAVGMDAGARGRRGRRRPDRRRGAVLSQKPQPGRVRLRPRLGGRLRAGGRALLPEASGRGPFHARDGTAPACRPRRSRRRARGSGRGPARGPAADRGLVDPRHLPDRRGRRHGSSGWASSCVTASSSTSSATAFRPSTSSSPLWRRASAKRSSASGGTRWATT